MKRKWTLASWITLFAYGSTLFVLPPPAEARPIRIRFRQPNIACTSPTDIDTGVCNTVNLNLDSPFVFRFPRGTYNVSFASTIVFNAGIDSDGRPTGGSGSETRYDLVIGGTHNRRFRVRENALDGKIEFANKPGAAATIRLQVNEDENLGRLTFATSSHEIRAETERGLCRVQEEAIPRGQNKTIFTGPFEDPAFEPKCLWIQGHPGSDYEFLIHQSGPVRTTWIDVSSHDAGFTLDGTLYRVFITGLNGDRVTFSPEASPRRFTIFDDAEVTEEHWGRSTMSQTHRLDGDCPRPEAGCDGETDTGEGETAEEETCIPSTHDVTLPEIENGLLMYKYRILPIKGTLRENRNSQTVCFEANADPFAGSHRRRGDVMIAPVAVRISVPPGTDDLRIEYERGITETRSDPEPTPPEAPDTDVEGGEAADTVDEDLTDPRNTRGDVFAIYTIKDACRGGEGRIPFFIAPYYNTPRAYPIRIVFERDIPEHCFIDSETAALDEQVPAAAAAAAAAAAQEAGEEAEGQDTSQGRVTQREHLKNNISSLAFPCPKDLNNATEEEVQLCVEGLTWLGQWSINMDRELARGYESSWAEELRDWMEGCDANVLFYFGCLVTWIPWLIGEIACRSGAGEGRGENSEDCGTFTIEEESRRLGVVVMMSQGILEASRLPTVNNFVYAGRGKKVVNLGNGNHVVMALGGQTAIRSGFGVKRFRTVTRGSQEEEAADKTLFGCGLHECHVVDDGGSELIYPGSFYFGFQNAEQEELWSDDPVFDNDVRIKTSINFLKLGGGTHKSAFPMHDTAMSDCQSGSGYSSRLNISGLDFCKVAADSPPTSDDPVSLWHGILVKTDAEDFGTNALVKKEPPNVANGFWGDRTGLREFNGVWDAFELGCLLPKIYAQTSESINQAAVEGNDILEDCRIDFPERPIEGG